MTPQLELRKMNRTCAFDEEGARSPGQVMVPDAAGRGTRLMTARPDPRFQPSRAPQHWRLTQQNSELEGREARAAMMKMYVTGSFAYVAPTARERALKLVVSWPWVLLQLFALALDAATLVSHVASAGLEALWASTEPSMIHALRIGFLSLVYLADVLLRVYGFGAKVFFAKWPNVLDALIVAFTALHAVATVTESAGVTSPLRYLRLLRAFRVLRIIRIALFMSHTLPRCCQRLRRVTGENKRRFVSLEHDFDLDLVYITPRLISMSVPAAGCLMQLYRNPLSEVVRFFETFHTDNYLIVNACPEIRYDQEAFESGSVEKFYVKDHRPPPLSETVRFLARAQTWMAPSERKVIAVHCRGGKGRTGSFCCAWLLYTKEAEDAEDALNFYALRRTDLAKTRTSKVQGVETPSQVRYVGYVERLLRQQAAFCPAQVACPEPQEVRLKRLRAEGFFRGPLGGELTAVVQDLDSSLTHLAAVVVPGTDLAWDLKEKVVSGDIGIFVYLCPAGQAHWQGGKAICSFFVHSNFLEGESLSIPTAEVDQACKDPNLFDPAGALILEFSREPR